MARLLFIGANDIVQHCLDQKLNFDKIFVLLHPRSHESTSAFQQRKKFWSEKGAIPIVGNLDNFHSLQSIQSLADVVIHVAPPQSKGTKDQRTQHLLAALSSKAPVQFIYLSSTSVYGNCPSRFIDETQVCAPQTQDAWLHLDAENQCRAFARRWGSKLCILRSGNLYNLKRLPVARVRHRTPILIKTQDIDASYIHTDDLCQAILGALYRGKNGRIYNITDNSALKMGDFFDLIADYYHLPRPTRLPLDQIEKHLTPQQFALLKESRCIQLGRWIKELKIKMKYPTVQDFFKKNFPR